MKILVSILPLIALTMFACSRSTREAPVDPVLATVGNTSGDTALTKPVSDNRNKKLCNAPTLDEGIPKVAQTKFAKQTGNTATPQGETIIWPADLYALSPYARLLVQSARPHMTAIDRKRASIATAPVSQTAKLPPKKTKTISPDEWRTLAKEAEEIFGVDAKLVLAVIRAESDFNAHSVSPVGAEGAMQIMPKTQEDLGLIDPFDPRANVYAGTQYLMKQLHRFGSVDLAVAAYNAGPHAVAKYGGIPPYQETQGFVRRVLAYWRKAQ